MATHDLIYDLYDEFEDINGLPPVRNMPTRKQRSNAAKAARDERNPRPVEKVTELAGQADREVNFEFSYNASRHEREWIVNSLGGFYDGQWLDDILRVIKGGKEAHVYHCLANESVKGLDQPYLAAKIYRPRKFRNLKNDHIYRQGRARLDGDGRVITNDGLLYAMSKRTALGLELMHTSWIEHEVKAMQILHQAGAER